MELAWVGLTLGVLVAVIGYFYLGGVVRGHPRRAAMFMAAMIAYFLIENIRTQNWVHVAIWGTIALAYVVRWWWGRQTR